MNETKYHRSLLNVWIANVPGAREYVLLIFVVLSVFLVSVVLSSFIFIKAIQIGHYAEIVVQKKLFLIVGFWGLIWLLSFLFSVKNILFISYRVAGPIKRIERLLDEILSGKDIRINVRENDALVGIAKRINLLLEMQQSGELEEQKGKYEEYRQRIDQIQQKRRDL